MPDAALSASAETDKLVVAGPPHALGGRLHLRNDSEEKLKIRGFAVRGRTRTKGAPKLANATMRAAARLRPGEQAPVAMTLIVPGETAPGVYEMEMEIGDRSVAVKPMSPSMSISGWSLPRSRCSWELIASLNGSSWPNAGNFSSRSEIAAKRRFSIRSILSPPCGKACAGPSALN